MAGPDACSLFPIGMEPVHLLAINATGAVERTGPTDKGAG